MASYYFFSYLLDTEVKGTNGFGLPPPVPHGSTPVRQTDVDPNEREDKGGDYKQ